MPEFDQNVDSPPSEGAVRPAALGPYQDAFNRVTGTEPDAPTPLEQFLDQPRETQQAAPPMYRQDTADQVEQQIPDHLLNPYETAAPESAEDYEPGSVEERLDQMQQLLDALALRENPAYAYEEPRQAEPFAGQPYQDQPFAGQQQPRFDPYTGQPIAPTPVTHLPPLDPYDEASVQRFNEALPRYLETRDQQVAQQAAVGAAQAVVQSLAPVMDVLETAAEQRGEESAKEWFGQVEPYVGKFDHEQAYLKSMAYVNAGADPSEALLQAARDQHEFEKRLWASWSAGRDGTAQAVAAAPTAVPAAPAAATELTPVLPGQRGYDQVADRYRGFRVVVGG